MSLKFPEGLIAIEKCPGYVWDVDSKQVFSFKSGMLLPIKRNKFKHYDGYQLSVGGVRKFRSHHELVKRYSNGNLKYKDVFQEVGYRKITKERYDETFHKMGYDEIVNRVAETFQREGQDIRQYQLGITPKGNVKLDYSLVPYESGNH